MTEDTHNHSDPFRRMFTQELPSIPESIFAESLSSLSKSELISKIHELRDALRLSDAKLVSVLEISSTLRETLDYDRLLILMMERISLLMQAERSTLFILEEDGHHLRSRVLQGETDRIIRLPIGQGIAGCVALSGESVNCNDVYSDTRFNAEFDAQTGFETHCILCVPIRNHSDQIIGTVQVLNSKSGRFSKQDEDLLNAISCQVGIAVENQKLYQNVLITNQELESAKQRLERRIVELNMLYDIEHHLAKTISFNSMLRVLTQKTALLLNCASASVVLRMDQSDQHMRLYFSAQSSHGWSFQLKVLTSDEEDAFLDFVNNRHSSSFSLNKSDIDDLINRTNIEHDPSTNTAAIHTLIGSPLFDEDNILIGSIHATNTIGREHFSPSDSRLLDLIANRISGSIVARRRADELAHSERLAAIGRMLAGIVHDLKTPITVISGYIQFMARSNDPQQRESYKKRSLQQLYQLTNMTRELLIFAKGENSLQLEETNITELFQDLSILLNQEMETRNVHLNLDLQFQGFAKVDPNKINRAAINLIRNAADAMKANGGNITLSTSRCDNFLVISVADQGHGIPPSIRDTLFDSFITLGKTNGTGLGLAIVKNITELHNGNVTFQSEQGAGTTFTIRIPLQ